MSTSPCPPPLTRDWAAVARDYAGAALTVSEICALHDVTPSALYHRAKRGAWKKRTDSVRAAKASAARRRGVERQPDLAQRLLLALDQKMTEFENRMAEGNATSAADSERDARTLNTLVRLFDRLKGFGDKNAGAKNTFAPEASAVATSVPSSSVWNDAHDADRLRHDLAQRLEKLRNEQGR